MGTSSYSMADIASLTKSTNIPVAKNSTSRTGNTELTMQDFLQLMVVQLQNQSIDDTMDTSEMMNQMVQMQMVTAITNMNEISVMTYASSMVGKIVTIGIVENNTLEEREVEVIGTGISNGQQVIFGRDGKGNVETYALNQIMAVGRLPEIQKDQGVVDEDGNLTDKTEGTENNGNQTQEPDVDQTEGTKPPEYNGEQGAPTDNT